MRSIIPSELASLQSQSRPTTTTFDDLYGMDATIQLIQDTVLMPLKHPARFQHFGVQPLKGLLIDGPPGTGKTALCHAIVHAMGVNVVHVQSTQIRSMIIGESEKAIAALFTKARALAPCVLVMDQLDAIVPKRHSEGTSEHTADRIVTTFLTEMDGIFHTSGVFVLAATSRKEALDSALLRPGRLDLHITLSLPDTPARLAILKGYATKMPLPADDIMNALAAATKGLSGADLVNLCREAAMTSLRESLNNPTVTSQHMASAASKLYSVHL
jgi:SpoVK/Ycf46/Vps4 family AAA+-type ATPase